MILGFVEERQMASYTPSHGRARASTSVIGHTAVAIFYVTYHAVTKISNQI